MQRAGAPCGARVTMCAARITMYNWGKKVTKIMTEAGVKIWLKSSYVDDIRFLINLLKNLKWDSEARKFVKNEEEVSTERSLDEEIKYSAEELRKCMESINSDLKFTTELEQHFSDKKLPTLDTSCYLTRPEDGKSPPRLDFEFFEKLVNSIYCILEKSAMDYQSKFQILSNEVIRRLFTTSEHVPQDRVDQILDQYVLKLCRSGYSVAQARQIIISGLRGYIRKVKAAEESNQGLHRSAESSLASRIHKKTFEKTSWYKETKKGKYKAPRYNRRKQNKKNIKKNGAPKAVLFVPRSNDSLLCKRLRAEESKLAEITGWRCKIVERNGDQLRRILCQKNPFTLPCSRKDTCMVCWGKGSKEGGSVGQCRRRNLDYKLTCDFCSIRNAKEGVKDDDKTVAHYYGEVSRSAAERSAEHVLGNKKKHEDNPIYKHKVLHHPEEEEITFTMSL